MNGERTLNIRAVQHFMYCPRRFALLEINDDWAENAFVVKANLMHEAVHSGSHDFSSKGKIARSGVSLYNDDPDYNIFGVVDCVEFAPSKNGAFIPALSGRYAVRVVEYKPKPPKDADFHESDAIQVFAQKLCADAVWGCDSQAFIYYAKSRRRVKLPFDDPAQFQHYDSLLRGYLSQMRELLEQNAIPPRRKAQKCSGCSLDDYCFPKSTPVSIQKSIRGSFSKN